MMRLITNHGRILAYLAGHPHATAREVARELHLTEARVWHIISDLEANGLLMRVRQARRNEYHFPNKGVVEALPLMETPVAERTGEALYSEFTDGKEPRNYAFK